MTTMTLMSLYSLLLLRFHFNIKKIQIFNKPLFFNNYMVSLLINVMFFSYKSKICVSKYSFNVSVRRSRGN